MYGNGLIPFHIGTRHPKLGISERWWNFCSQPKVPWFALYPGEKMILLYIIIADKKYKSSSFYNKFLAFHVRTVTSKLLDVQHPRRLVVREALHFCPT